MSYDDFGRCELLKYVSWKDKIQNKTTDRLHRWLQECMTELEFRATRLAEQIELLQSEVNFMADNFNDLKGKQFKMN